MISCYILHVSPTKIALQRIWVVFIVPAKEAYLHGHSLEQHQSIESPRQPSELCAVVLASELQLPPLPFWLAPLSPWPACRCLEIHHVLLWYLLGLTLHAGHNSESSKSGFWIYRDLKREAK